MEVGIELEVIFVYIVCTYILYNFSIFQISL